MLSPPGCGCSWGLEVIGRSSHSRCGQADLTRAGVDLEPAIAVATADAVAQRGASIGISRLNRADHIGIAAVLVIVKCIRRNWRAWIVWIFKHWRVVIYILLVQRHVDVAAVGAISCCHRQVVDVRQGLEVIGRSSHSAAVRLISPVLASISNQPLPLPLLML